MACPQKESYLEPRNVPASEEEKLKVMGQKVRLQRWTSDDSKEEIHFFAGEEFVIGYNPKKVAPDVIRVVLSVLGYETD